MGIAKVYCYESTITRAWYISPVVLHGAQHTFRSRLSGGCLQYTLNKLDRVNPKAVAEISKVGLLHKKKKVAESYMEIAGLMLCGHISNESTLSRPWISNNTESPFHSGSLVWGGWLGCSLINCLVSSLDKMSSCTSHSTHEVFPVSQLHPFPFLFRWDWIFQCGQPNLQIPWWGSHLCAVGTGFEEMTSKVTTALRKHTVLP